MRDFLNSSSPSLKNNLLVASEEFISDIYADFEFLRLNAPLKRSLLLDYYQADLVYKSLDKNGYLEYVPVSPLYEERSVHIGMPPVLLYSYVPV